MNPPYEIRTMPDGEHWISLERLRDTIRDQRISQRLTPFQEESLMMAATLVDALLLEVGVERVDQHITLTTQ